MTRYQSGIINQVNKRFQTTIIGTLARFEETFGYLWGHDSDRDLNEKEQKFLEMWEYVRTSILNHGNNQMRYAMDDLIEFVQTEQIYKYDFIITNKDKQKEQS
jgi:hypothetical protein